MSTAAELVRETKQRIGETQQKLAELSRERNALALAVARGDPQAIAGSLRIRGEMAACEATAEDLSNALPSLEGFADLERRAADVAADRQRRQQARQIARAHVKAAEAVDQAVALLAVAMKVADHLAQMAHATAAPILGHASSLLTTQAAGDAAMGGLVALGAMPIATLPSVYVGEVRFVRPLADAARRHAALVERHVQTDDLEVAA